MQTIEITAQERVSRSKVGLRQLREEGMIPCVLYSREENKVFAAPSAELRHLVFSPEFKIAEIKLNGTNHRCILKEIQFDPITDKVTHVDFLKLVKNIPIKVSIPLRLKGTAAGVKSGGKLTQKMRSVVVKTTPENLVGEMFVDVTSLELGQTMRIRDIIQVKGIEVTNPPSTPIVSVEIPRSLKTGEGEAATASAAAPAADAKK